MVEVVQFIADAVTQKLELLTAYCSYCVFQVFVYFIRELIFACGYSSHVINCVANHV